MLRGDVKSGNEQRDIRSIGLLVVRLLERSTSLQNPDSLDLENPGKWDDAIKSFIQETASSSAEVLQKVSKVTR